MARFQSCPLLYCRRVLAAALLQMPVTPVFAQQLGQGSAEADFSIWRLFAAMLFLLVLAGIAWALVKLRGRPLQIFKPAADRRIEILEVARISGQSSLCLVRFDDAEYLLAVAQGGTTLIEKRTVAANATDIGG